VFNAALDLKASPTLIFQPARSRVDFADPATLAAISTEPDVMFTVTRESLGNDPCGLNTPYKLENLSFNHLFYYLIATHKSRGAWCPSADLFMFRRTVPIDYPLMWDRARKMKTIFDNAKSAHITTALGTDLFVDLTDSEGMLDDGDYRFPGTGGNLPAGEVFCIPSKESYGVAVIDGSAGLLDGTLVTKNPFRVYIENCRVVRIEGAEEADTFRLTLDAMKQATQDQIDKGLISSTLAESYLTNCYNLCEFGIGLNPAATISGNMTEDEKVLNTCHIAVGDDCYGQAPAVAHLDLIITKPIIDIFMNTGEKVRINPSNLH
jgi:aminopeptidase